jgi:hypothetical protein
MALREKFNDLSPQLLTKLQEKFDGMPEKMKYRFDIKTRNPTHRSDPSQPEFMYAEIWQLTPVTYRIQDPGDKKYKWIGLVSEEDDKGVAIGFKRLELKSRDRGLKTIVKSNPDAFETFIYLELHPAHIKGLFENASEVKPLFEWINESKESKSRSAVRRLLAQAMEIADNMTTQDERDFAASLGQDEFMDEDVLHDYIGTMAENEPEHFLGLIKNSNLEIKAAVKRAESKNIITWDENAFKYVWSATGDTLVPFAKSEGFDRLSHMADWLKATPKSYDKITNLLKAERVLVK